MIASDDAVMLRAGVLGSGPEWVPTKKRRGSSLKITQESRCGPSKSFSAYRPLFLGVRFPGPSFAGNCVEKSILWVLI